jgi:hypothetical protein
MAIRVGIELIIKDKGLDEIYAEKIGEKIKVTSK